MTDLRQFLGIEHAIIQAPLGGGPTTPEMVVAVAGAGALGSLAGGYLSGDAIASAVRTIRANTARPFAINLLVPPSSAPASTEGVEDMLAWLAPYYQELGVELPQVPDRFAEPFDDQVQAMLAARPAVFSFTFGIPPAEVLAACRAASILTMGTATTVAEGRLLEQAGIDVVVAQGSEAGGHRGTFAGPFEAGMVGAMALVPQMVDAVSLPVVAAGGIMDGRGIVAARALGAAGAQLGTAFMACAESGIRPSTREPFAPRKTTRRPLRSPSRAGRCGSCGTVSPRKWTSAPRRSTPCRIRSRVPCARPRRRVATPASWGCWPARAAT